MEARRRSRFPGLGDASERRTQLVAELAAHRDRVGLTQTEVAARMGTSQSAVARLEAGESDARLSTLERYASAVGVQLQWSLEGSQSTERTS